MPYKNSNFCSLRCNVCVRQQPTSIPSQGTLLKCSNCKLISYCGKAHQKQDWKQHKQFCYSIGAIINEKNIKHILDLNGPIQSATREQLHKVKLLINSLLIICLERELEQEEKDLVFFPNICNVCYEYNIKNMIKCDRCFSVGYCNENHKSENSKAHSLICENLRIYYNLYENNEAVIDPIALYKPNPNQQAFPSDLFQLLTQSMGTSFPVTPTINEEYEKFVTACNYSNVATILSVIFTNNLCDYVTTTLVIHVVGANTEIALFTRNECWLLFHWLPKIDNIKIVFIGPDLMENNNHEFGYGEQDELKLMQITYIKETYEEFCSEHTDKPHLIISFNCGFSEYANNIYNQWTPALECMLNFKEIPIAFTSYTQNEAKMDLNVIQNVAVNKSIDLQVMVNSDTKNPYRDLRPYRNWENDAVDEIYHYNGYLHIVAASVAAE